MLVGDKSVFAMEYEIIPHPASVNVGHFCMWVNGYVIGDYSEIVVLGAVEAQLLRFLRTSDKRADDYLFSIDKFGAINTIIHGIYGDVEDINVSLALTLRYSPFNLSGIVPDQADPMYLFVVSGASGQRFLWKKLDSEEVMDVIFPAYAVEGVAREYLRINGVEPVLDYSARP